MEDDEEYSYKGYSADTAALLEQQATYIGEEEEYSYRSFTGDGGVFDETAAAEEAQGKSYGDFIIEEFSAEVNIRKVTGFTHLNEELVNYLFSAVYLIVGVLCVSLSPYVRFAFNYIVGGFMALVGLAQFISAMRSKEYVHTHSNKTATSLIMLGLSVLIILESDSADVIIAIAWGFLGLLEAAHAFNHAFSRIARSQRCAYYLVKGIIEVVLAFLLLHDPTHHLQLHIVVFGINLIFDSITMFPPLKRLLSRR